MTKYQAQFYYEDTHEIYFVNTYKGSIDKVTYNNLSQKLFPIMQDLLIGHPEFDYASSRNHVRRLYFTRAKDKLIVYLWIGQNEPSIKIFYSQMCDNVHWYTLDKNITGWLCGLDYSSLFFAHTEEFFLQLLNRYLQDCSTQEHQRILNGRHYLNFSLYYPSFQVPPYLVGTLEKIEASPRRLRFKRCPSTHIPCEMNTLYMRLTWYVRRVKWKARAKFYAKDIRL